jgi:fatty acid desaturase
MHWINFSITKKGYYKMSDNPYTAPDADLAVDNSSGSAGSVKEFPRFTAWAVFGLSMITLGFYGYYWLYSRTTILNKLSTPENRIASWLPMTTIIVAVLYWILSFAPLFMGSSPEIAVSVGLASLVISIAYMVFFLMWTFGFRKRLNLLSGANKGEAFWLGGFMTFFFNVIYFQYKINQMHDQG